MERQARAGFTLTETLIIGALFALFVLVGSLLLSIERARTRDTLRVADMTRVAASFAVLYAQQASYSAAAGGCGTVGDDIRSCTLPAVVPSVADLVDPGKFSYTVSRVPDAEDFGVRFRLERGYGSLAAGTHTLTKAGIQ